ncbi:MAG: hypothetical protein NC212_08265 [Staphylococcus sp.]|nr:hypothetical protein [Staphylococcus sp.]
MTEEQKDILIAKMLDAPSTLSDGELDAILHDDELRDIYEASSAVSSACVRQPEFDMEAEWKRFRPRLRRRPTILRMTLRVAAIFLGVVIATGIIVKMTDRVPSSEQEVMIAMAEQPNKEPDTTTQSETIQAPREMPADSAVSRPAPRHKRHIAKATVVKVEQTVPPSEDEFDVDEYLRVQQAKIDNELAMQAAAAMIDELTALQQIYDLIGEDDELLEKTIRKVTME